MSGEGLDPGGIPPGTVVAGYRVEARIGQGGMASVYRARGEWPARAAALKVMAPEWAADREFRQRFLAESRAAARISHPHVIDVYEAGEDGEILFIAMRLVSGGDLKGVLHRERRRDGGLSAARTLELLAPVAAALDAAHAAGLVHRDVKPTNILIDRRPGGAEHVYLSDFGVAKDIQADGTLTQTGQFIGTPDYAAPEQAQGEKGIDGRLDQYALACMAFELLTGHPPFEGASPLSVLSAHVSQLPPRLTQRRPDLPAGADAVLARALAKAPGDRYPTCENFIGALADALPAEPGKPAGNTRPGRGTGNRRNVVILAAAAGVVALAAAVTVSLALATPGTGTTAAGHTTQAVPSGQAASTPVASPPASAPLPSPAGNPSPTRTAGSQPSLLIAELADPSSGPGGGDATQVAVSPSGTLLAAGDVNGNVYLWNLDTMRRVAAMSDPLPVVTMTPVPTDIATNPYLEASSSAGVFPLLAVPDNSIDALAFAPGTDGGILAAGDADGDVYLWSTAGHVVDATLPAPAPTSTALFQEQSVTALAYTPDGTILAAADLYGYTYLWDAAQQTVLGKIADPPSTGVDSLAFAPDGTTLAMGNDNGTITLWDTATGKAAATLNDDALSESPGSTGITSLAFSPDGRTLVAGDADGSAYVWNLATRTMVHQLTNPDGSQGVSTVAFAPGGTAVAVGNGDGSTSIWLAASGKQTANLFTPGAGGVSSLAFAPSGALLAVGCDDGDIGLWRVTRQETS